jgi:DNA-binding transcriptional LysR family regulator
MESDPLPHLDTFAEAAERSSFTATARALRLTQAAVSQRIAVLEQALGTALFERRSGRVLLTEAGRKLHDFARRILELHREARAAVSGQSAPRTGELSLAASSVPGEHLLPDLLEAFRRRHPQIRVRASVADTRNVLTQVEQGQAHLGLVGGQSESPRLEYRSVGHDTLALLVPPTHPWSQRKRVTLKQLAEQPLIVREEGSGSRACLERDLERAGWSLRDLRIALELGSNEGIKEAVLRGLGLAVLSTRTVTRELESGQLRAVHIAGLPLSREMFVVWDRRRALPIPARLFLDLLENNPADAS